MFSVTRGSRAARARAERAVLGLLGEKGVSVRVCGLGRGMRTLDGALWS